MDSKPGHRRGRSLGEGLKLEESEKGAGPHRRGRSLGEGLALEESEKGAGPHRRGRSLGEGLELEESERGALVVSGINNASSASQGLKEGDEIVGATIHFDELSKEDVLKLLKLIEPFDEKVEVLTKNKLRPSLGTLNRCLKTPEEMLNDSYNRLYNDKIKRFMKDDTPAGVVEGKLKANAARPQWSEPSLKGDNRSPQKDKKTLQVEVPSSLRSPDLAEPFSGSSGDESHGLNVPEAEGGVSRFNTAASSPNLHATDHRLTGTFPEGPDINIRPDGKMPGAEHPQGMVAPNVSLSKAGLEIPGLDSEGPEVNVLDKGLNPLESNITVQTVDINAPRLDIEGMNNKCEMPKFKIPDLGLSGPNISEPDCSAPGFDHTPKLDLNAPDVNMKTPSGKVRVQSVKNVKNHTLNVDDPSSYLPVKLPKVRLSGKVPKGQDQDIDTSFKTSIVDLRGPMMDASLPNPDIKSLKGDLKLSDADIDDLKTLDLNLSAPKIDVPDCSLPSSGKLKMPDFGFSGTLPKTQDLDLDADVKTPNLSLKAPKIKGGVNITDMGLPQVDLKTPKVDINTPEVDMNAPSGKLKRSKFKMPTFGLSRLQGPDIGINGNLEEPNLGFSSPKFKSEMSDPKLDISLVNHKSPGIDVDGPSGKFKVPSFKMPDFSLSGPKAMASDSELKMPDLGLSGHELKKELSPPDLSMPDIDLKGPNAPDIKIGMPSGKFNTPTLKNPDTNLSVPGIEADAPSGKFKMPKIFGTLSRWPDVGFTAADLSLKAPSTRPDLDLPNMDIKTSTLNTDIGSPKGKFKLPKLRLPNYDLSGLKEQNFNMDGDLDRPNVGLPKPVLDIDAPSLDLKGLKTDLKMPSNFDLPSGKVKTPTLNIKEPKMDVNTLGLDVDAPSGKFKLPKFKMPTFSLSGLKGPDIDIDGEAPDVDINTPQVNVKSPKMDLKMPDVDMGSPPSKFKMPGLKMPDFGLTGPNIERPDFDLNPPDLDLSAPKLKGRIGPSDLKLPKADLNTPKLDLNGPDINLNMPSGKLRVPTLKKPKVELGALDFNVDTPSGKLKMPTLDVSGTLPKGPSLDIKPSVKKTDFSLKGPKIKGGIDAPKMDLPNIDIKTHKFDVNTTNVDFGSPKTKFKIPKFKMPSFGISGLKQPDIEGDLEAPDVDINTPQLNVKRPKMDLKMPDVDMGSSSSKFKMPGLKMPDFGLTGPNIERPDFDLNPPDLDLSAPKLKGRIGPSDLKLPKADLNTPKLDLNGPDINLNMPSGKLRVPTLKKPKAELGALDFNVDTPSGKMKMPTLDVSGTLPKGPSLDIKPSVKKTDLSLKGPKIKGGIDAPDFNLPNIDSKLDGNTPNLDIASPKTKLKMPKLKMPTFGFSGPKGPGVDVNGDLEGPDLNIPHSDVSSPSGKFKIPSFKMPGFGLSGPKVTGPDMDLSAPEVKGGIYLPDMDFPNAQLKDPNLDLKQPDVNLYMPPVTNLKAPKPDMNSPDVGIHFPTGKFKTPTLKIPKCSLSGLSGQDAELNGGIEGLGNEMPLGNIKGPQTDFDLPEKKIKLPSLKMPQFGGPDLKRTGSDVDFGTAMKSPDMIVSPPTATCDVKEPNLRGTVAVTEFTSNINTSFPKAAIESPKLHPKASELDIDAPSSKHRMPRSKHKSDISGSNVKIPVLDIDADVKWTHTDKKSRKVKGRSSYPVVDADLPKADLTEMDRRAPDLNIDDISDKFHILKPKMSNLDQSHAEILDINSDSSPKISVPKLPTPKNYEQGMVVSQPGLNFSSKTDLQSHPQHRNATAREIDSTKRAKSTNKSEFGISMPDLTYNPDLKSPEDPEGYYVTVFPKQTKAADRKVANRKSATLGRLDFSASNVDLEVPEENDLKGSTFWFSKLI